MSKLSRLPPRLASLPPRLARGTDAHGHGQAVDPWRSWYSLKAWRDPVVGLRMQILIRDDFTCQCGCGVSELDESRLVADHITPHRGDPALFWDPANLQTLRASPCHNQVKQRQEREARGL